MDQDVPAGDGVELPLGLKIRQAGFQESGLREPRLAGARARELERDRVQIDARDVTFGPHDAGDQQRNFADTAPQIEDAHTAPDAGPAQEALSVWIKYGALQREPRSFAVGVAHDVRGRRLCHAVPSRAIPGSIHGR